MKPGTTQVTLILALTVLFHPRVFSQSVSGVVNAYYAVTSINTATNSVIVDNSAGLEPGETVLIIQMKGATIDASNTATFGNVTAINNAGAYEFNTVCSVTGNQVWLTGQFVNTYSAAGQVQVVAVASYQSVTISGTVTGNAWDPVAGKGGIVAIAATDTIFLNADIDVSGQGFIGGALFNYVSPTPYNCAFNDNVNQYFLPLPASGNIEGGKKGEGIAFYITGEEYARGKLANGGGGGNNANSGGAGGGHYGTGGGGGKLISTSPFNCQGQFPGVGGLSLATYGYSTATNRIFPGGGGGSGHENNGVGEPGGNGGGIIILSAPVLIGGGGKLLANGAIPINPACTDPVQADGDGGGGGGAGGAVILNTPVINGAVQANANGAAGSNAGNTVPACTGPGGGGGGGVVWTAGASVPAAVTPSVTGGANGVISPGNTKASCVGSASGATAGTAGISQAGYTAPLPGGNACVVLATPVLKSFTGAWSDQGAQLNWVLYPSGGQTNDIRSFTPERSTDQVHFSPLTTLPAVPDSLNYGFTDPSVSSGTVFYRLSWTDKEGSTFYSSLIALTSPADPVFVFLRLHPNPVSDPLSVDMFSRNNETGVLRIFNAQGQELAASPLRLHIGTNSISLPVGYLSEGVYFLQAEAGDRRQSISFIKKD
jgi:hypothetical protein